jgi:hypothetical protein
LQPSDQGDLVGGQHIREHIRFVDPNLGSNGACGGPVVTGQQHRVQTQRP